MFIAKKRIYIDFYTKQSLILLYDNPQTESNKRDNSRLFLAGVVNCFFKVRDN